MRLPAARPILADRSRFGKQRSANRGASKGSAVVDDRMLRKRSVRIAGHATSVSLEPVFWQALAEIARGRGVAIGRLLAQIDAERRGNLSSAIRIFVLDCARAGELPREEQI